MTTEQRKRLIDAADTIVDPTCRDGDGLTWIGLEDEDAAAIRAALARIESLESALRRIADSYDPSCHGTAEMENHETAIDALENMR